MMPVVAENEDYPEVHIDYRQKYKTLKKKLRLLVYEQECFLDELRKAQRKLLKVSRDRSFLLDQLLQHEKLDDSSEESDATNSTDTDDGHREAGPAKKRKLAAHSDVASAVAAAKHAAGSSSLESLGSKKKSKGSKKKSGKHGNQKTSTPTPKDTVPMTREELERHLESKQHEFGIEKASASLPMEIFSNDPNHDSDAGENGGEEEEDDLIIDVPH